MAAMKKLLLASSLATLVFLAASALSENVFVPWKGHQREYAKILADRTRDAAAKREILATPLELQQIVVPDLHLVDRCVTCHRGLDNPAMAGAPNPYAPHPGDILKIHPPEKFGCTVCHRGQGAAINFREAKATDVYWDYPLLPPSLLESSCGICHDPDTIKGAPVLNNGARLFEEKGCHSCHRLGGLGGSLGAELDSAGLKTRHQLVMTNVRGERTTYRWLDLHFKDPQGIVKDSLMKPDYPTDDEALALTVYMLSLQSDRELPDRAVARDRHRLLADGHDRGERDGRLLYERLCRVCHGDGTYGAFDRFLRRFVPAIRNPAFLALVDRKYLRANILEGRPGTLMAGFEGGMTGRDLENLLDNLAGGRPLPVRRVLQKPALPAGERDRGGAIFVRQCAGCHDPGKRGQVAPTLSSRAFLAEASDAMIVATIAGGRQGTAMVAFTGPGGTGLSPGELSDLLAYIRSRGPGRK